MSYINNLHDKMLKIVKEHNSVYDLVDKLGITEEQAKEVAKKMSFADYQKVLEGDNPFGSFSKPGEVPTNGMGDGDEESQMTNKMGIDPNNLEVGDMIDYTDEQGNRHTGKIKDTPDMAGRMTVVPDDGTPDVAPPLDIEMGSISSPDEQEVQQEIQRLQKLAGIGAQIPEQDPEMEESATGGGTGAGAVAGGASINPMKRKHSPHGKAFKSARSKTSEYKRSIHKRGPKK